MFDRDVIQQGESMNKPEMLEVTFPKDYKYDNKFVAECLDPVMKKLGYTWTLQFKTVDSKTSIGYKKTSK